MSLKGGRADNALNRSWFGPISARPSVFAFAGKSQLVGLYAGAEYHVSHIEALKAVYSSEAYQRFGAEANTTVSSQTGRLVS